MKKKVKILGFYKRKRDENEYVLYEINGRLQLTNGVFVWRDCVEKHYLPRCEKVLEINLTNMIGDLKKYLKHLEIIPELEKIMKDSSSLSCGDAVTGIEG